MLSTRSGRTASVLAAAALVGAGLLATVPAYADDDAAAPETPAATEAPSSPEATDTPETPAAALSFTASPTSFTLGAWNGTEFPAASLGGGLALSGTGFAPSATVTVTLAGTGDAGSVEESTEVSTDESGAFDTTWTPEDGLQFGLAYTVTATDGTVTADDVELSVLAPAGIVGIPNTISTQELHDTGVVVIAGGFAPGEAVAVKVVYGSATEDHQTTANVNGAVGFGMSWYGTLSAGTLTYTLTGAESGHVETTTITVTGDTVTTGPGGNPIGEVTPTTPNLPKVSG